MFRAKKCEDNGQSEDGPTGSHVGCLEPVAHTAYGFDTACVANGVAELAAE